MQLLTPELVLSAYSIGLFPMANDRDDPTIHWIDPLHRGVLPLDRFHVPRSLRKTIRRGRFELSVNRDFPAVIAACAEATPDRPRTWLNDDIIRLYVDLHRRGHACSIETWEAGRLVGGLYGLALGGAFCGESMFSRATDASKVALVELVARLRIGGFVLLDTQFVNDHLAQFGIEEITRSAYKARLKKALTIDASLPVNPGSFAAVLVGRASAADDS
jgi:leucyl/phenylalanyl-tRNA--protein transferase